MSTFKSGVAAMAAMMLAATSAQGAYFTYAQFEQLSVNARATYIAGAYDAYTGLHDADEASTRLQQHRQSCISNARMTNVQLAENVAAFARAHPQVQAQRNVLPALIGYFNAACGYPPGESK
ncbi:hypothetical protein CQ14_07020 [Bradyrhizobium lablabi]|uniref:UrcA family protein n=1 Tax=Bradyrhizobium lablabi TaxID=722472 RepID=A0A0R3MMF2_9BRAD|nr:hypothetical protein [Bradyrhizobium lablabi]KRR21394.1 hypothetical protein CQ14_07020 [Bradyrhizobium lablabi]